jgi:hypothetical protein
MATRYGLLALGRLQGNPCFHGRLAGIAGNALPTHAEVSDSVPSSSRLLPPSQQPPKREQEQIELPGREDRCTVSIKLATWYSLRPPARGGHGPPLISPSNSHPIPPPSPAHPSLLLTITRTCTPPSQRPLVQAGAGREQAQDPNHPIGIRARSKLERTTHRAPGPTRDRDPPGSIFQPRGEASLRKCAA